MKRNVNILIGLALVTGQGSASNFQPVLPAAFSGSLLSAIGLAMISTLFAYDGWHFVGYVAGEIRDPQRNVPRSIILGVFICADASTVRLIPFTGDRIPHPKPGAVLDG